MRRRLILLALAWPAVAAAQAGPDGAALYARRCAVCHQGESSPAGPSLSGVYGRSIASLDDFDYSAALRARSAGRWSDAELDAFLAAPDRFAPGTLMFANGLEPAERRAIIAFLKRLDERR